MTGTIDPPCGVPAHRMGRWENEVLGIWWCPDCGEEIWVTEGTDGEAASADDRAVRPDGPAVPVVRHAAPDGGDAAGAPGDRASGGASGVGWRDSDGGARLWHLILEAFGRAAS